MSTFVHSSLQFRLSVHNLTLRRLMKKKRKLRNKRRGPPAKPKVPSVRPDVVASGQLPVKKSKPMHLDEYVVSDNLSGNTHSKIREVFSRLALDLARTFSSHLRLAVILSLGAPFGVAACLI